ncbi:MAG: glycosyltransferase family 4 protein [Desulfitobacteriaceae bacterium]|nr:glycosyltransferase family 4 protein [Desulfitobacteriaceae bacterium]
MGRSTVCIVHGSDLSIPNGATDRVIAFVNGLVNADYDVHLVVPKPKDTLPDDVDGVYVHTINSMERGVTNQITRATELSLKAKKIANNTNALLQIEHSTLAGFASILGCYDFILDMHDLCYTDPLYLNLPFSKYIQRCIYNIEGRAVKNASKIIVVSEPMKKFIIGEWDVPEDRVEVIPSGFFASKISESISQSRVDPNVISRVGSLFVHLDIDAIVALAESLQETDVKIHLVGGGVAEDELKVKIKNHNLENVVIRGWVTHDEALRIMQSSLLTFESISNTMTTRLASPIKILNYAALGKPIVLSDVSELSYVFKENDAALVSDPSDIDQFVENVHLLLDDANLRNRLGNNALNLVYDYSWEKQGEKLAKILDDMN